MITWFDYPEYKPKKVGTYLVRFGTRTSTDEGRIFWEDGEWDLEPFALSHGYRYIRPIAFGVEYFPLSIKDGEGKTLWKTTFHTQGQLDFFIKGFWFGRTWDEPEPYILEY